MLKVYIKYNKTNVQSRAVGSGPYAWLSVSSKLWAFSCPCAGPIPLHSPPTLYCSCVWCFEAFPYQLCVLHAL